MKISKYVTIFLTALFIGIVLLEQMPGVMTPTSDPYEAYMFGLFKISLLDDITHGISGVLGLAALFLGYRMRVFYLMLIGGYYALDALFFVVNGFFTRQPLIENMMLNGPHIGITVLVIFALWASIQNVELKQE